MTPEREKMVAGLREMANWLEENPDTKFDGSPSFNVCCAASELPDLARQIGKCEKIAEGSFYILRRMFGPIRVDWFADRDKVCKRVKTGERVIPAQPERVLPATPERVEDVYEWKCPESLLKAEEQLAAAQPEPAAT